MAVDEVSAATVAATSGDRQIRCLFLVGRDHIEVTVSTQSDRTETTLNTIIGQRILRALVDEASPHTDTSTNTPLGAALATHDRTPAWTGVHMIKKMALPGH